MLTESLVSLLTGTFPGCYIMQRRIMLTESSVSFLTGIFLGLLINRGGQVVLVNVFSLLGQSRLQSFLGGTCELPPYWIIPGLIV